jgi:WD40 repeat protein
MSTLDRDDQPDGATGREARRVYPGAVHLSLGGLNPEDGAVLLERWLRAEGRTLQDRQFRLVLRGFAESGLPLWLRLATDQVRRLRSFDRLAPLPATVERLVGERLDALARPQQHGPLLVEKALGYLAAARNGLADDELLELLARDDEYRAQLVRHARHDLPAGFRRVPMVLWSRLHDDLTGYLAERHVDGANLVGFYHRVVAEAVSARAQAGRADPTFPRRLAAYFGAQPHWLPDDGATPRTPNLRKIAELAFQQTRGQLWTELTADPPGSLCDLSFVEASCAAGFASRLSADYQTALDALPPLRTQRAARRAAREHERSYAAELSALARRCRETGHAALPQRPTGAGAPVELDPAADRLQRFSAFYTAHQHVLARQPQSTIVVAANHAAAGPVAAQARSALAGATTPWLDRDPRPAEDPLHPMHVRTFANPESGEPAAAYLSTDGRLALSGGVDGAVRVWDTASGACVNVLAGHSGPVSALQLSPDGTRVLAADHEGLHVWDMERGTRLRSVEGMSAILDRAVLTADGERVLFGGRGGGETYGDTRLRYCDTTTGTCLGTFEGHPPVALSLDGRRALTCSGYGEVRLWDTEDFTCLTTLSELSPPQAVALSWDGRLALTGGDDGVLYLWDLERQECVSMMEGHTGWVDAVALSPDGSRAVSGAYDQTVRVWDVAAERCTATLTGHKDVVWSIATSPDLRLALSVSGDGTVMLWDLDGEVAEEPPGHGAPVDAVAFVDGARSAVSVAKNGTALLWDVADGRADTLSGIGWVTVAADDDGHRLLVGGEDGSLTYYDLPGWTGGRFDAHSAGVATVALSADGSRALSGGLEGKPPVRGRGFTLTTRATHAGPLRLWDVATGTCLATLDGEAHPGIALSADGARALSCGRGERTSLCLWDTASGACRTRVDAEAEVRALALAAGGNLAVSGHADGDLRVWDVERGACLARLTTTTEWTAAVAISPDGRWVLSGGWDGVLHLWDVPAGGRVASYLAGSPVRRVDVRWPPGRVVAACEDGRLHLLTVQNRPWAT